MSQTQSYETQSMIQLSKADMVFSPSKVKTGYGCSDTSNKN